MVDLFAVVLVVCYNQQLQRIVGFRVLMWMRYVKRFGLMFYPCSGFLVRAKSVLALPGRACSLLPFLLARLDRHVTQHHSLQMSL